MFGAVTEWQTHLTEREHLLHMLRPYDSEPMEAFEVSRVVNAPAFNGPECIQPVHGSPPVPEVLVVNSG
jgi:putative SOS response-associated peptidase YedK